MLIEFIRHLYPSLYWSAGFLACLVVIAFLSTVLYVITRYKGWLVCLLATVIYAAPFFFYMR